MESVDAAVVALALEPVPVMCEVHDLAAPARDGALRFAVVLRPFSVGAVVSAHHALLQKTGWSWPGRVVYLDAARPRPPALSAHPRVVLGPEERAAAAARAEELSAAHPDTDTDERVVSEEDLTDLLRAHPGEVVAELDAAVFEIVPDPFAPKTRGKPRILVADDDPTTSGAVGRMGLDVEVVKVTDGWSAVERILAEDFDLVLCAVKLGELGGSKVFKMVLKDKPSAAGRIVFVADAHAVSSAPPSSVQGRVLARPIDAYAVRDLLERFLERERS